MNKLNSFMGIPFGSSKEFVAEKMLDREGVFDEENSSADRLIFDGVVFAGRKTDFIQVIFFDNQLCKARIVVNPYTRRKIIDLYDDFKDELNIKYYTTEEFYEFYDDPFEKDDGKTEEAISLGKARISSYWFFPDYDDYRDCISLKITESISVEIVYEKDFLYSAYIDRIKERNREDL
jgi:hypothetical protein